MQPAQRAPTLTESPASPQERPWLFTFLIAPEAVVAIGLVDGALSFLLRNEGVNAARVGSILALLSLPHAIYFLWSPVTDFWMRRRAWLMTSAVSAALVFLLAFNLHRLSAPGTVWMLFLGACLGVVVAAACGGIMGTLRSETNRRRAGSFYQCGSLAFGGLTVFLLVTLAPRVSLGTLGWIVAALIALPSLAAFAAPAEAARAEQSARATAARIWSEFKSTFLHWKAIPYTLLITAPFCSGAMIGLLPGLARDYGVSGREVAWMNGAGGALLTAAGALSATLIPVKVRVPIAYPLAGLVNAAVLATLVFGPLRLAVYFAGTVLFLFTIGVGYALFTAVALEFLGRSGKSGSSRYAIINSLGNIPVAYMSFVDGRGYALWGPRGMPGIDAGISAAGATLFLLYFAISSRRATARAAAGA